MAVPTRVGDVIAQKYRVERVLGAGGMGVVVEATHLALDEKVAIKFLKPEALENTAAVARFAREARAAAKIKSEHVARVSDVVVDDGMPFLVMEYLEGEDLDALVTARGPLSVEDGVDYVLQACEALAEAHVAGIVHRDLKPANLHLSRRADGSPRVKVLDFGISKIAPKPGSRDAAVTATSSLLGSPLYMSPEQMKATRDVDARTDLWSVGVILYEILTADQPFKAETIPQVCALILSEPPQPLAGRVPSGVEAVIMKCLEKRPEDRFQNVGELARALAPFAPARSALSVERVVKVVGAALGADAGRASMPGATRPSAPAAPPVTTSDAADARSQDAAPTLPADTSRELATRQPTAPFSLVRTPAAAAGTHNTFEAHVERAGRAAPAARRAVPIALAAGAVVAVVGLGAALFATRGGPRAGASAPIAAPEALAPGAASSAAAPSAFAPPAPSAAAPSAAPSAPPARPAASSAAPIKRPAPAARPAPAPSPAAPARSASSPKPAAQPPAGTNGFGGRE